MISGKISISDENTLPGKAPAVGEQALDELEHFYPIANPLVRVLVSNLPPVLVILLLADWLVGSKAFAGDVLRLPAVLVCILELVIINSLFNKVPKALRSIWVQGLVRPVDPSQDREHVFLSYIHQFKAALNSRLAWIAGGIFALAGLYSTFPVLNYFNPDKIPYSFEQVLSYYFWGTAGIVTPLLGYLFGLIAWRGGVIAVFITRLGKDFELESIANHPDRSGGLRALGDLCFNLALALLLPAIFFSYWGIAATYFHIQGVDIIVSLWSSLFRNWLVVLVILGFFLFFQPLYQIHLQMLKRQQDLQSELGRLAQKMNEIALELRNHADTITPEEGAEKLEQIEFMEKIYQKNYSIPTWPFDTKILIKFSLAQAVPVLSLIGTSAPLIDLVKSILSSLSIP
jgi:hypothetical protein